MVQGLINEQARKNFHERRGNCYGHGLDELWEQIRIVDSLEKNARDYLEEYIKNPDFFGADVFFMNALRNRVLEFNDLLKKYNSLFFTEYNRGKILLERRSGGEINLCDILKYDNCEIVRRCKKCRTEIPYLDYEGWNE